MKIAIGSDHGGFELKTAVIEFLQKEGHTVEDLGTHSKDSCDYPLIGFEVGQRVGEGGAARGILICKTGVGMAIIANKCRGVRAAVCLTEEVAASAREHNDCNVLVLAASFTEPKKARQIVRTFLATEHAGDRHARRVKQIRDIETKLKGRTHG